MMNDRACDGTGRGAVRALERSLEIRWEELLRWKYEHDNQSRPPQRHISPVAIYRGIQKVVCAYESVLRQSIDTQIETSHRGR
jgi:hypothetical protein